MDQETIATTKLKGKLEQAVIFGDRQQNPLAFDLKVGSEGDLVTAAEAVSKEILASCQLILHTSTVEAAQSI